MWLSPVTQGTWPCAGDWLALKYDCKEIKDRLSRQFQAPGSVKKTLRGMSNLKRYAPVLEVSGIPALVVLDSVGRQVQRSTHSKRPQSDIDLSRL